MKNTTRTPRQLSRSAAIRAAVAANKAWASTDIKSAAAYEVIARKESEAAITAAALDPSDCFAAMNAARATEHARHAKRAVIFIENQPK